MVVHILVVTDKPGGTLSACQCVGGKHVVVVVKSCLLTRGLG
jgi:hypothetical protein